jgi:hypothetical protein
VTLADGTIINTSRLVEHAPEKKDRQMTMMQEALAAGKMKLHRKLTAPDGTTMYEYQVKLADGTTGMTANNMPIHDKALTKRHQDELEKARAGRTGQFLRELEIPGQPKTNIYQVTLSDGDVAVYFSPNPPAKETPRKSILSRK